MCVSQFREYCKASSFQYKNRNKDLANPNLEVKKETHHYNSRNYYYTTDLEVIKKLAKNNNEYAIKHLSL